MKPTPQSTTYALRQQLNLAAAILLVLMVAAGCLALEVARQQHADATRLVRWQEQLRLADTLRQSAEQFISERLEGRLVPPQRQAVFDETFRRLMQHLGAFQRSGTMALDAGHTTVDEIVRRLDSYHARVAAMMEGQPTAETFAPIVAEGIRLQVLFDAVAAMLESASISHVERASRWQLAAMGVGLAAFLLGVWLLHRSITHPLQRMVQGIETMRRTGRLVKVPVVANNELGLVAGEFNRLAEHIEEQKQRLRQHIVELQRVNIELDRLANLKDDFLATINHQLRTPLTAVFEGLMLLKEGVLGAVSGEQRQILSTMEESSRRLMHLVEEVLDLTMLRSGRRMLDRHPDDLAKLLREVRAASQSQTTMHTVTLDCHTLPPVFMDPEAIHDVMDHLLRNALRHAPTGSEIRIEARSGPRLVEVSVKNTGQGLTQKQVERLFQPFVHLHSPDAPGSEGGGMGLALCRQVIQRHAGTIRAESGLGQGTTVTFTLPIASASFLFEDACRGAKEEAEYETEQFGLVLLAPDGPPGNPGALEQLETFLRRHTHHGDRFVRIDDAQVAIVAVTNQPGLRAMTLRLCGVLAEAGLPVQIGTALHPADGETPERLLQAARSRLAAPATYTSAGFLPQIV